MPAQTTLPPTSFFFTTDCPSCLQITRSGLDAACNPFLDTFVLEVSQMRRSHPKLIDIVDEILDAAPDVALDDAPAIERPRYLIATVAKHLSLNMPKNLVMNASQHVMK